MKTDLRNLGWTLVMAACLGAAVLQRAFPARGVQPAGGGTSVTIECAAFSHSGKYVVVGYKGSDKASLGVWDVDRGNLVTTLKFHKELHHLPHFCSFLADDERILSIGGDGMLRIHKLISRQKAIVAESLKEFRVHETQMVCSQLSSNGKYLITVGRDPGLETDSTKVWDLEKGAFVAQLEDGFTVNVGTSAQISGDGNLALTKGVRSVADAEQRGEIFLWNIKKNKVLKTFLGKNGWIRPHGFSENGREFVLGKMTGKPPEHDLVIWDVKTLEPTKILKNVTTQGPPYLVRQKPGTNIWFGIGTCSEKPEPWPSATFWDFDGPRRLKTFPMDNGRLVEALGRKVRPYVGAIATSPKGDLALVASGYNREGNYKNEIQVHIWDLTTGKLHRSWTDKTKN